MVAGSYKEFGTAVDSLTALSSGGWKLVTDNDTTELYDTAGNLVSITYRGGQTVALTYSTSSTPSTVAPYSGLLINVADPFGHQLSLTYNSQAQITSMTDHNGAVYTYTYSGQLLSSVLYPDSTGDPLKSKSLVTYWWPAHRPVYVNGAAWSPTPNSNAGDLTMVNVWWQLGFVVPKSDWTAETPDFTISENQLGG